MPTYISTTCTTATTCSTTTVTFWVIQSAATNAAPTYCSASNNAAFDVAVYNAQVDAHNASARARQVAALQSHAKEAQERAHQLLLENLSKEQRATFEKNGWFVVQGGKSGKSYRINNSADLVANIDDLERFGGYGGRLCAHAGLHAVPLGDHLLAQKLMLEYAEDDFLAKANRHAA